MDPLRYIGGRGFVNPNCIPLKGSGGRGYVNPNCTPLKDIRRRGFVNPNCIPLKDVFLSCLVVWLWWPLRFFALSPGSLNCKHPEPGTKLVQRSFILAIYSAHLYTVTQGLMFTECSTLPETKECKDFSKGLQIKPKLTSKHILICLD